MKKAIVFFLLTTVLSIALVSCDLEFIEAQHNHKYSKTWVTTDTEHWREATCEHSDLIVNKGEHTFDDGVTTKSPTEEEEGVKTFTCTECKFTRIEPIARLPHTHKYETETLTFNDHFHWYAPTCGHSGAPVLFLDHSMNRNVCTDCGYIADSQGLAFRLLPDGTYEVAGRGECTDSTVCIPAVHEGKAVTSIGDSALAGEKKGTTRVVIPSSIKKIGSYAFSDAEIEEVIFKGESSLVSIGDYAFLNCWQALKSITIPKSVTHIGNGVFQYCKELKEIVVEEGNTAFTAVDGNLYTIDLTKIIQFAPSNPVTEYIAPAELNEIGVGAFARSQYLEKVSFSLDSTMTSIPLDAFNYSGKIKEIVLPTGITSFGANAFCRCVKLEQLNIPENLVTIGASAFEQCNALSNIVLPSTVTSIGDKAFANCETFTEFVFPELVTHLSSGILSGCTNLENVTIPASITSYGTDMFYGSMSLCYIDVALENTKLKSIDGHLYTKNGKTILHYSAASPATDFVLPEGVTKINASAFYSCPNLVNITLPSTLKTIEKDAFKLCKKIETINLPEGLTTVGEAALNGCESLKSISFPSTLKIIPRDMLSGCNALREIIIPSTVIEIGRDAFAYIPLETLVFENTSGWTGYFTTYQGESSEAFTSEALSDNATAIRYLTTEFQGYVWKWAQPTE